MIKHLALLFAACAAIASSAEETGMVTVTRTDGGQTHFWALAEPHATFTDDGVEVDFNHSDSRRQVYYPLDEFVSLTYSKFDKALTGAADAAAAGPVFGLGDSTIEASGLQPGSQMYIISAAGITVASATAAADGSASAAIGLLAPGIYAVSAAGHTYKFLKR